MSKASKYKLFPRKAAQYNDISMHCPHCHKNIIIFDGFRKTHVCYKCHTKFADRTWKSSCAAYKFAKATTA